MALLSSDGRVPWRNWPWSGLQIGLLCLPLFPALGSVFIFASAVLAGIQKLDRIKQQPLNWLLTLFGLWLIVVSLFAEYQQESWLGLANFLPFLVLFATISQVVCSFTQLNRLAWILVLSSPVVVILGFGQLWGGWRTTDLFLGWELLATGNPSGRMASVFMYANILAAYLLVVLIFGIGLWLETYQVCSQSHNHKQRWLLSLLTIVVIGDSLGLIFTSSRNAWAIAFLAALAFAIYLGWYWLLAGVSAVATTVLGAAFAPAPISNWLRIIIPPYFWLRLSDRMYPDRPLATLRLTQWQFCWELTQQHPWLGWGLRNFTPLYQARMDIWLGHPHNLFLMLTAEVGIPGTICLASAIAWILTSAIFLLKTLTAQARLRLFTYLVAFCSLILFNLLDVTLFDLRLNILAWIVLASIYGVSTQCRYLEVRSIDG